MSKTIETIRLNESIQDFYEITNDSCPICEDKIETFTSVVKLGSVAYHSECYFKNTTDSFKIR